MEVSLHRWSMCSERGIPFAFATGLQFGTDVLPTGCVRLAKPFSAEQLRDVVEDVSSLNHGHKPKKEAKRSSTCRYFVRNPSARLKNVLRIGTSLSGDISLARMIPSAVFAISKPEAQRSRRPRFQMLSCHSLPTFWRSPTDGTARATNGACRSPRRSTAQDLSAAARLQRD